MSTPTPSPSPAPIRSWAAERLTDEVRRSIDRLARSDDVQHVAVMPDVHLGRDLCIGTAFATRDLIYVDSIGGDIGCGMAAVSLTGARRRAVRRFAPDILRALQAAVPIQRHRRPATASEMEAGAPDPGQLSRPDLQATARSVGPAQLGTLGTGNHFLELQSETATDRLWLMVHSGSRGLGPAIRAAHVAGADRSRTGMPILDRRSPAGSACLQDMAWARRFAAANRRAMLAAAGKALHEVIGCTLDLGDHLDCDHNHVSAEEHFGEALLVHRKGAMPADEGRLGVVPGSMATPSHHVVGRGHPDALRSSAHGAGRRFSRAEARRRISRRRLATEARGGHGGPAVLGGLRDEAPSAYKDIRTVMKAQRPLVRVQRTLDPLLTHKGRSG